MLKISFYGKLHDVAVERARFLHPCAPNVRRRQLHAEVCFVARCPRSQHIKLAAFATPTPLTLDVR